MRKRDACGISKDNVSSERTERTEKNGKGVAAPHKGNKVMRKLGKNRKKDR
jgi:hypothetical protein